MLWWIKWEKLHQQQPGSPQNLHNPLNALQQSVPSANSHELSRQSGSVSRRREVLQPAFQHTENIVEEEWINAKI